MSLGPAMDDFERAVLVLFSQEPAVTADIQEQASGYCDAVKSRPDACQFCWAHFVQRERRLEVRFWCLQTILGAVHLLPAEQRLPLRLGVLAWLREAAPAVKEDVALRNKLALLYVTLLRLDYPETWPAAWADLLSLLGGGAVMVDLFLRVLATFDQEVASEDVARSLEELQRNQFIKVAMQQEGGDLTRLADCWYQILVGFARSEPELAIDCLKAIGVFAAWVDPALVANSRFLDIICPLIQEAGPPAAEACDCLAAVFSRKMAAERKVRMMTELHLLQRLDRCFQADQQATPLQLVEKQAELVNSVAEAALEAYEELREQPPLPAHAALAQVAWDTVAALLPSVVRCFAHPEVPIAESVEPVLMQLFAKIKAFTAGDGGAVGGDDEGCGTVCHSVSPETLEPFLRQTLHLFIRRAAYPDWFQHADVDSQDDERHIQFLELRRSVTKLFKRALSLDERMALDFLQTSVAQLVANVVAAQPMEAEALLFLLKEAGENATFLTAHLQARGPLAVCFLQILDCEALLRAEHWAVQLALLELYVRYGRILAVHQELFPRYGQRVLEAFLGSQGIRASDLRVVTRACFMFGRFVKMLRAQVVPLATQIFESVQDLLVIHHIPSSLLAAPPAAPPAEAVVKGALRVDDQAYIYEALAFLLTALPHEQLRPGLQHLLRGPGAGLTLVLNAPAARLSEDLPSYCALATQCVEVVATVSKAPSGRGEGATQPSPVAPDWQEVLAVLAGVLRRFIETLPQCPPPAAGATGRRRPAALWSASLMLSRRMVEVLEEEVAAPLDALLPLFYAETGEADVVELTTLGRHVVTRLKQASQPLLERHFGLFFGRPYEAWSRMAEDSTELRREKSELACSLLQLLKDSCQYAPALLLELLVVAHGGTAGRSGEACSRQLSHFLLAGLRDPAELRALLLTVQIWSALLDFGMGSPGTGQLLAALPVGELLGQILWSVARVDQSDVQSQKILGEAASVLRSLTGERLLPPGARQQAMATLEQALAAALPGLQSGGGARGLYEVLLREGSLKDIRAALQQCVLDWRRDCGADLGTGD